MFDWADFDVFILKKNSLTNWHPHNQLSFVWSDERIWYDSDSQFLCDVQNIEIEEVEKW